MIIYSVSADKVLYNSSDVYDVKIKRFYTPIDKQFEWKVCLEVKIRSIETRALPDQ